MVKPEDAASEKRGASTPLACAPGLDCPAAKATLAPSQQWTFMQGVYRAVVFTSLLSDVLEHDLKNGHKAKCEPFSLRQHIAASLRTVLCGGLIFCNRFHIFSHYFMVPSECLRCDLMRVQWQ